MGNFTDVPQIRTVAPEGNHDGMKFISITEGFCMIDGDNSGTNYDTNATPSLASIGGTRKRSLILKNNFPTGLRTNEKCLNATLEMWLKEPIDDSLTLSLHRLLKAFVRDEVNWNDAASGDSWSTPGLAAGVDYEITAEVTDTIGNLRGSPKVSFTLDTWVNDVCNDGADNFGFILILSGGSDISQVIHGDSAPDQQRPVLVVETAYEETIQTSKDTFIWGLNTTTNYGTNNNVAVRINTSEKQVGLLDWDLSSISDHAEIASGKIFFRSTGAWNTQNVVVSPILVPWEELECTWEIASTGVNWGADGMLDGTDYDSTVSQTVHLKAGNGTWEETDITDVLKAYNSNKSNYHGLVFYPADGAVGDFLGYQRHVSGGAFNSYLEIQYRT